MLFTLILGFCVLHYVYFNNMQINRWLYLSSSLREFTFAATLLEKNRPKQFPFYRNKLKNFISFSMTCKIILCSEFPDIPDKAGIKTIRRKRIQAIPRKRKKLNFMLEQSSEQWSRKKIDLKYKPLFLYNTDT